VDQYTSKLELLEAFFRGNGGRSRIALFVGAGASADADMPTWEAFRSQLEKTLKSRGINGQSMDVFQLAEIMENKAPSIYRRLLWDIFRNPSIIPGEIDKALAVLKPSLDIVVTTNFDKLLETAFRKIPSGIDPPVVTSLSAVRRLERLNKFCIFKIHGDIDDLDNLALSLAKYSTRDYDSIFNFLQGFRVVFIGYGFRDPIIELFRRKVKQEDKTWFQDCLVLYRDGAIAQELEREGVLVIKFQDFDEQKSLLKQVAKRMYSAVAPLAELKAKHFVPDEKLLDDPIYEEVLPFTYDAIDKVLVLEQNWGYGWDSKRLQYCDCEQSHLSIPSEVETIIQKLGEGVTRPWWGKYAYGGFVPTLSEKPGIIHATRTNYRDYKVCHDNLDTLNFVNHGTLRETYWQYDICERFSGSNLLPHIICAHLAVITADERLLLTRRGKKTVVMNWDGAWSPTIEGQASAGNGLATCEEIALEEAKGQGGKPVDSTVWDTCCRELREELAIPSDSIDEIRIYAVVSGWSEGDTALIGVARLGLSSQEVENRLGQSDDPAEFYPDLGGDMQHAWIDLDVQHVVNLLLSESYGVTKQDQDRWHFSAKARLFAVAADMVRRGQTTWQNCADATSQ